MLGLLIKEQIAECFPNTKLICEINTSNKEPPVWRAERERGTECKTAGIRRRESSQQEAQVSRGTGAITVFRSVNHWRLNF